MNFFFKIFLLKIFNESHYLDREKPALLDIEDRPVYGVFHKASMEKSYIPCFKAVFIRSSGTPHRAKSYRYTEEQHGKRREMNYKHRFNVGKQQHL